MNEINQTLYIPLYGKAAVSRRGLILHDPKAEEIWAKEGFALKGKSKSKWLTYYMAMRARVFDRWTRERLDACPDALVLHIGCGMDSRCLRLDAPDHLWYDLDFPAVIQERRKYYPESDRYHMLAADASQTGWLSALPQGGEAIVVLEGVSMYLTNEALAQLFQALQAHFATVHLLMDCYTVFAAKASKYKNPVKDVGAAIVSGLDDPKALELAPGIRFLRELDMTPPDLVAQLPSFDRRFFALMFAGRAAKKIYRLFAYRLER